MDAKRTNNDGIIQVEIRKAVPTQLLPGQIVMYQSGPSVGVLYKGNPDGSVSLDDTSTDIRLESGDATHLYLQFDIDTGKYESLTLAEFKTAIGLNNYRSVTENATLNADTDLYLEVDATGGNRTVNVPSAITNAGKSFVIKKVDSSTNYVSVTGFVGGQMIDGIEYHYLRTQNAAMMIYSDGANWKVIAKKSAVTDDGSATLLYPKWNNSLTKYEAQLPSTVATDIGAVSTLNWGNPEGGYKFDGVDDYVTVADNANLDFGTGDFSIEWSGKVEALNAGAYDRLITKDASGQAGFALYRASATTAIVLELYDGSNIFTITTPTDLFTAGAKLHITCVVNGRTSVQMYVNGTLQTVTTSGTLASIGSVSGTENMVFDRAGGTQHYTGVMHLIRLYNRALTQAEVTSLYNNGRPDLASLPYDMIGGSQTELLTNGNFGSGDGTGWSFDGVGGGSTQTKDYTGNKLKVTINDVGSFVLYQAGKLVKGKQYRIKYTIADKNNTDDVYMWEGTTAVGLRTTDGTVDTIFTASTTGSISFGNVTSYQNGTVFSIDDISLTQIGCVAEYLPENAGKIGWIETQNGLHGQTSGSPVSLNAENRPLIYRDVKLAIATATPTLLTGLVPKGYKIVSIVAKGSASLTAIKIGTSSSGEQIVASATATATGTILTLASTANDGFSITADTNVYVEHTTAGQTMDVTFQLEKLTR